MAQKKTQSKAQKAAASKTSAPRAAGKSSPEKEPVRIPVRLITSLVCLVLFVLFLTMALVDEGWLILLLRGVVLGLIGKVSFYVAIPGLAYLFVIQAFSGRRPIVMRSVCMISFILLCGCFSQLFCDASGYQTGTGVVSSLYQGGVDGSSAGFLCGGLALLLSRTISVPLTGVALVVAAAFTLLGAFQITIPSIIRAVQNRPRADWEEEPREPDPEPAAVVVNTIANKRIEYVENKRRRQEEKEIDIPVDDEPAAKPERSPKRKLSPRARQLMEQIDDAPLEEPVAAAQTPVAPEPEEEDGPLFAPPPDPVRIAPEAEPEIPNFSFAPAPEPPKEATPTPAPVPAPAPEKDAAAQPAPEKVTAKDARASAAEVAAEIAENQAKEAAKPEYRYPPIELLKQPSRVSADATAEMRENTRRLNETLASFRIDAHIINVTRGPSVTRYEVELDKGVKLSKLTGCADDIALSLGASGVRIAAVPGKISVVGIEVPNRTVTTVSLREVIDSPEFRRAKSKSSFAVGKDIGGSCIVGDIAKLPHMLIAGTTGSGKSVCMNSIIISLLYKAAPEEVKLIMVDPKMVELGIYNGIPHLLIPVVTDPKKAAGSLQWAVTEMMRRYKAMSDAGVRDLESYNTIVETEQEGERLPQVVVIIDELADLMLAAAKEVEESICRIAQMGRAAGIHLIIATQRPSADVITGLMKANIPSRIAFAVSSAMESRIILDTMGAEKLVGRGDMLFAPIGIGKPIRVQGCFVSDPEVEAVAAYVKENFETDYDMAALQEIDQKAAQVGTKSAAPEPEANAAELDGDELLPDAVDVILESGMASVSMLQRRLKLGYARAARIVDEMEDKGIVGPFQGSKPREILITKEQWAAMRGGANTQLGFDDLQPPSDPEE